MGSKNIAKRTETALLFLEGKLPAHVTIVSAIAPACYGDRWSIFNCSKHGEFAGNRYKIARSSGGCPKCTREITSANHRNDIEERRAEMLKRYPHWKLYEYKNQNIPAKHKCLLHNFVFYQNPRYERGRCGCPWCSTENRNRPKVSEAAFLERLAKIETTMEYVSGYNGTTKKATFYCNKHKIEYDMLPRCVLRGNKCPQCKVEAGHASAVAGRTVTLGRREVWVQGFEDIMLDYLVRLKRVKPKDIVVHGEKGIVNFWYTFAGRRRITFPDMYIKSHKLHIEVKSTFTLLLELRKTQAKYKGAKKNKILYRVYVVSVSGRVFKLPKGWEEFDEEAIKKCLPFKA